MINVAKAIKRTINDTSGEQPKFWGVRKKDNKSVLVKYDACFKDYDTGYYNYVDNTSNEYYAFKMLEYLSIPCAKVELAIDLNRKKRKKCVIIENFLQDDEELIEFDERINEKMDEVRKSITFKEFIDKLLDKIKKERNISEYELEEIEKDLINLSLVDYLIGNPDRYHNIGIIYNKEKNSYRLSPAYDNGRSFYYSFYNSNIRNYILDGIFSYYSDYVQEIYEKISNISKKDLNKIFGLKHRYLKDNIENNIEMIKNSYTKCKTTSKPLIRDQVKINNADIPSINNIKSQTKTNIIKDGFIKD